MRRVAILTACLLLTLGTDSSLARQWSFTKIADTTTPGPGGIVFASPNGTRPFSNACLGLDGRIAFFGRTNALGDSIYVGTASTLQFVAGFATAVPGGGTFNQGILGFSFDGGPVAFLGVSSIAGAGGYAWNSGIIQTVVDRNTPVPGGSGNFSGGIGDIFQSGSSTTFLGVQAGNILGWYRSTSSGLNPIVTASTPIPNGSGNFTDWGWQSLSGDRFTFSARNATTRGVYSRDASGTEPLTVIADTTMLVPGTNQPFAGFTVVSADGPNTAFQGGPAGVGGIWAHINGQLTKIVDINTPGPGGEQFTGGFQQVSISGNNVAFLARLSLGSGIFVWRNGTLSSVVKYHDVLGGITVDGLTMTSQALRGDTIAFTFNTPPGAGPVFGGVYTATFVPGPGVGMVLAAAGAWAGRRPRRRSAN